MSFNFREWTDRFLNDPYYNDAGDYGVTMENIPQSVYDVIGVHHLTPDENRGGHALYLEILDEFENREFGAAIEFTKGDQVSIVRLKQYSYEVTDLPLFLGDTLAIWHRAGGKVSNVHTRHGDERDSNGELGNSTGHHSFYTVFKKRPQTQPRSYGTIEFVIKKNTLPVDTAEHINLVGKLGDAK